MGRIFRSMNRAMRLTIVFAIAALLAVPFLVSAPVIVNLVRSVFPEYQPVHVIFGGDMMFDRTVRSYADKYGGDYLFTCLDPIFAKADLVVANLEGPITDNASISRDSLPGDGNNYTFTFPTSTAALLAKHHIGIVDLGNNHTMNFGASGVRATTKYLDVAGVKYFGDPLSKAPVEDSIRGIRFEFISYNQFGGSASTTIDQIRAAKKAGDLAIVFAHWGEEYQAPTQYQKDLAHEFVDAGADMIVGAHPHVVQISETYKNKQIFYSLGNLIFDQYWNADVSHGLMIDVTFDADGVVDVRPIPVELGRDRVTCPH